MKKIIYPAFVLLLMFTIQDCEDMGTKSKKDKYSGVIEGVDFEELFKKPTQNEIDKIYEEWNSREYNVVNPVEEDSFLVLIGTNLFTLRIISHEISPGVKHFGGIIIPIDTTERIYPLLVYNHGGETGVDISELLTLISINVSLKGLSSQSIMIIPSFRSESLSFHDGVNENIYLSGGTPSPWDLDVDDSINLLNTVIQTTPEADETKIVTLGISRGGAVSMLMSARDDRIKKTAEFFGPTDFYDEWIKEIMANTLEGIDVDLPGIDYLDEYLLQPLKNNQVNIEFVRHELLKRSPIYFLPNIVPLQIHHGEMDYTVPVSQANLIIEMAEQLELSHDQFQSYIYQYSGHDQTTLMSGMDNVFIFLASVFIFD